MSDEFWSPQKVADTYDIPLPTVRAWRYKGTGPPGTKIGKHVRYRASDVHRWFAQLEEQERRKGVSV